MTLNARPHLGPHRPADSPIETARMLIRTAAGFMIDDAADDDPDDGAQRTARVRLGRDATSPDTIAWATFYDHAGNRIHYDTRAASVKRSGRGRLTGRPHMSWELLDRAARALSTLTDPDDAANDAANDVTNAAARCAGPVLEVSIPQIVCCECGSDGSDDSDGSEDGLLDPVGRWYCPRCWGRELADGANGRYAAKVAAAERYKAAGGRGGLDDNYWFDLAVWTDAPTHHPKAG